MPHRQKWFDCETRGLAGWPARDFTSETKTKKQFVRRRLNQAAPRTQHKNKEQK
jgi:hypothetical protein